MNDYLAAGDYIDWNQEWSYPLQWLWESMPARIQFQQLCYRTNLAMIGKPWKNLYQEELTSAANALEDRIERERMLKQCVNVPEGRSFALADAVQTAANQLASGVDTYEYQINDPYGIIDDDTEANLAACCSQDYVKNGLEDFAPIITRDMMRYGLSATLVTYDKKHERNIIRRINPKNTWWDTMYSSTGNERYRGYSTMIDWDTLKKMIKDSGDEVNLEIKAPAESIFDEKGELKKPEKEEATYSRRKIRTLNGLDIYVGDMNKLAVAPGLQGFAAQFYWDYDHDLRSCYNLNWYHTFATDPKAMTKSGYHGMDVELTVIYDLNRHIEFKIINRRFVIAKNEKAFKREILFPIYDPRNDVMVEHLQPFQLECPLIFRYEDQDARDKYAYPTSRLTHLLDVHDELCSWRAKRAHVSRLLALLRITTNGADASTLKKTINMMGVILDDIQGDIKSVNFEYSYDPIDSQIAHLEQVIQTRLSAYTQFDAMQAMGDRASAAESGMALGAVAQGLATLQNSVMDVYAKIARQMIANRVVYSPLSELPIINNGEYSSVTIAQMALEAIVVVKSKLAKKIQEKMLATNAVSLIPVVQNIFNEQGIAMLIEQATMGNIPRKMAQSFMKPAAADPNEIALAQQQAANDALALQNNQMLYEQNPLPYEADAAMAGASPEEIDAMIEGVSAGPDGVTDEVVTEEVMPLDMLNQEGSMTANLDAMTSDMGSALANANSLV